ncbi:hypothetical protein L873DRAFT_1800033 [Choiromyces venosus 120613-1]|uniref:Uncharacterized protein n=1 Tax=Choiromyces venosus 120613-1 TaxID=1336337 RepID=A0A3N4KDQ5_9PEZI|nr:hypothetical protein L873DRAFT_1800033 [Choiromyces venosus 120613-1]
MTRDSRINFALLLLSLALIFLPDPGCLLVLHPFPSQEYESKRNHPQVLPRSSQYTTEL